MFVNKCEHYSLKYQQKLLHGWLLSSENIVLWCSLLWKVKIVKRVVFYHQTWQDVAFQNVFQWHYSDLLFHRFCTFMIKQISTFKLRLKKTALFYKAVDVYELSRTFNWVNCVTCKIEIKLITSWIFFFFL